MEEPSSPSEQDILVSRLIARISELEERLYKRELESPAVPSAAEGSSQQSRGERPKEGQGLLAAFKDSWRAPLAAPPAPSSTSDWFFSVSKQPLAAAAVGPSSSTTSLQRLSTQPQPAHADTDDDEADGPGPSASHGSRAAGSPSFHAGSASSRSDSFVSQARYGTEPEGAAGSTGGAPQPPPPSTSEPPRVLSQEYGGSGEFEIMPTPVLQTPLIINGVVRGHGGGGAAAAAASAATPPAPPSGRSVAQDWLSSLFAARRQPAPSQAPLPQQQGQRQARLAASSSSYEAFNEKAFQASLEERGRAIEADAAMGDTSGSYYRYVFDPVDVQAEMEVTARVRKAAAEALMEAEEKLRAAEEAQAGLRQQLGEAMQLQEEVERLKRENEAALQVKKQLEDQMIGEGKKLESMEQASQSLQQELEGLREQREIWKGEQDGEQEKLKAENALLRRQLQTRLNDLQLTKNKLSEAEAEKQRLQRDVDDQAAKLQWLQRINGQLESSAEQLEHYKKAAAAFQERFIRERNVRRKLHDQLQVLKGNIRVMCRVRPALPEQQDIITYPLEGLLCISPPDRREQEFEFDHVFAPESTQEAVYEEVSSLVRSCADGYNVCIFAYGQTGSGKTFTMEGPADNPGIYVRALQELFAIASEESSTSGSAAGSPRAASSGGGVAAGGSSRWRVSVAMIEIYNESVHDLLRPSSEVVKPLEVSGLGPAEMPPGMDRVQGLTWRPVSTIAHVQQVLREGSGNRATASTALNAHSSRSHALLSVRIEFVAADGKPCSSSLHLVDLAGSERVDKSEVTGQNLKEAQSINKSLSALGDVVSALQRRNSHIPFRNSKLTQVLQDSLCGSSKVLLVCNISPEAASASETLSSLNFASRAAQIARHRSGRSAGFAIVVFATHQEAAAAIRAMHDTTYMGRALSCRWYEHDRDAPPGSAAGLVPGGYVPLPSMALGAQQHLQGSAATLQPVLSLPGMPGGPHAAPALGLDAGVNGASLHHHAVAAAAAAAAAAEPGACGSGDLNIEGVRRWSQCVNLWLQEYLNQDTHGPAPTLTSLSEPAMMPSGGMAVGDGPLRRSYDGLPSCASLGGGAISSLGLWASGLLPPATAAERRRSSRDSLSRTLDSLNLVNEDHLSDLSDSFYSTSRLFKWSGGSAEPSGGGGSGSGSSAGAGAGAAAPSALMTGSSGGGAGAASSGGASDDFHVQASIKLMSPVPAAAPYGGPSTWGPGQPQPGGGKLPMPTTPKQPSLLGMQQRSWGGAGRQSAADPMATAAHQLPPRDGKRPMMASAPGGGGLGHGHGHGHFQMKQQAQAQQQQVALQAALQQAQAQQQAQQAAQAMAQAAQAEYVSALNYFTSAHSNVMAAAATLQALQDASGAPSIALNPATVSMGPSAPFGMHGAGVNAAFAMRLG